MNTVIASVVVARPPCRLPQAVRPLAAPIRNDAGLPWNTLLGPPALSAQECAGLDRLASLRTVAAGDRVFAHGDAAPALVALLSGDVAMGRGAPGAAMRTERLLHAPAWLDVGSAWLAGAHSLDALALTPVQVVELAGGPMQALLEAQPRLAARLLAALAGEVRRLTAQVHALTRQDAPARLAGWLHERCVATDARADRCVLRLAERKSDIASQLGMTPETLSRLMRALSDQRVIEVDGYTVAVLDVPALRRLAGG